MGDFKCFLEYLRNGNIEGVKESSTEEFVNKIVDHFYLIYPIHIACKKGFVDIVKLLMRYNCNIECQTKEGYRPIHLACQNGHIEIVKLLKESNCNIECEDFWKRRPIHWVTMNGHVEIVKFLLQHNCNIECETKGEWRPIHYANKNKHLEIVNLLQQHKINIYKLGSLSIESVKSNQNKQNIDIVNGRKLLIACKDGILTNVSSLLNDVYIEYCDEDNRRPIHWACLNGHIEIVKLLIERNCNIDATDNFNLFPMAIAENNNNEELINILKAEISDRQLKRLISMMGLTCKFDCDHKLCPKSLKEKIFYKGSEIGSGAFGEVFRCKGSGIDREFALKRVKFNRIYAKSIEGNINNFLSELNHVRIVKYFGAIQTDKYLCIFMEYLPGGSLRDKIKYERFMKSENIIFYSKQILEGLAFLHGNKIIHRDLKPGNILMDFDNNIKLTSFGSSRLLIGKDGLSTDAHTVIGTPYFMAPEVINEEPYNVSADIWAFGATLINMITGKPPYHNYDIVMVIYKIGSTKMLELPESVSNEMKIFLESILNGDPTSRPTATELLKSNLFI